MALTPLNLEICLKFQASDWVKWQLVTILANQMLETWDWSPILVNELGPLTPWHQLTSPWLTSVDPDQVSQLCSLIDLQCLLLSQILCHESNSRQCRSQQTGQVFRLIWIYTVHSQVDLDLHCSLTGWSGTTLFIHRLIWIYTVYSQVDLDLHCLFTGWSGSTLFIHRLIWIYTVYSQDVDCPCLKTVHSAY
jgi:hypothetical protein